MASEMPEEAQMMKGQKTERKRLRHEQSDWDLNNGDVMNDDEWDSGHAIAIPYCYKLQWECENAHDVDGQHVPAKKSDDDKNLCKSTFDCNLEEMLANMRANDFCTTFSKATQYLGRSQRSTDAALGYQYWSSISTLCLTTHLGDVPVSWRTDRNATV
ncbi:hypothetical protein EDD22DRAFT_849658 [Suillus occidentalis]|nr:hypothetical protein EDD22DRAFT_849658 [Suillus occidentalis]